VRKKFALINQHIIITQNNRVELFGPPRHQELIARGEAQTFDDEGRSKVAARNLLAMVLGAARK
jgi:hypothetical protein